MRPLLILALLAIAGPAAAQDDDATALTPKAARLLQGRVAGKPVDCIPINRATGSMIVDEKVVIFKESAARWYVNMPGGGKCTGLSPSRSLVTRVPSTRFCRGDLPSIVDIPTGFDYGGCPFSAFTPYDKVQRGAR